MLAVTFMGVSRIEGGPENRILRERVYGRVACAVFGPRPSYGASASVCHAPLACRARCTCALISHLFGSGIAKSSYKIREKHQQYVSLVNILRDF